MDTTILSAQDVRRINATFPYTDPMRRWKEQGKKIVGWGCTYVPEEIIRAAGIMPIRVTGDACEIPTDDADAYIYTNGCTYVRTILQLLLEGKYDFLDGYVTTSSCDGMRRLYDVWRRYITQTPFVHIIGLPRNVTYSSEQLFFEELQEFKRRLEEYSEVTITDSALREAIAVQNRTRRLLKEINELRRRPYPVLSGAESFDIVNAGLRMHRDHYNELLGRLLTEAEERKPSSHGKVRLMLSGSNLANPEFIAGIEAQGAVVVIDDLCVGARYWSDPVDEDPSIDPLRALSHRYLNNFPCARTIGLADIRRERLLELARGFRAQGLVNAVIHNCIPNSMDRPMVRQVFEDAGIPVLDLDIEYGSGRTGQVATRVQAFLEMLRELAPA